jgi:hypothetical protein
MRTKQKETDLMSTATKRILPDLQAQFAALQAENAALKARTFSNLKVSSKGGVSLYGLGRFPVTLYKSQWDKLLGMAPDIQEFLKVNESKLAVKS